MGEALPIGIFLTAMIGISGLNYLWTRLYAVFSALVIRLYCRKALTQVECDIKGNDVFHDNMVTEMRQAGTNMLQAMYIALGLLIFQWFFGQRGLQLEYAAMMVRLMKFAGFLCFFSECSKILTAMLLPARLKCREKAVAAQHEKVVPLLTVMFLYVMGLWLYSL